MFTFSELLNQWFADHSDGKKDNYFQFKLYVDQVNSFIVSYFYHPN